MEKFINEDLRRSYCAKDWCELFHLRRGTFEKPIESGMTYDFKESRRILERVLEVNGHDKKQFTKDVFALIKKSDNKRNCLNLEYVHWIVNMAVGRACYGRFVFLLIFCIILFGFLKLDTSKYFMNVNCNDLDHYKNSVSDFRLLAAFKLSQIVHHGMLFKRKFRKSKVGYYVNCTSSLTLQN